MTLHVYAVNNTATCNGTGLMQDWMCAQYNIEKYRDWLTVRVDLCLCVAE